MDEEIEKRLRSLDSVVDELVKKNRQKQLQKEIELRLAKLNERDPNYYSAQEPPVKILNINKPRKQRTDVEQADDLLAQLAAEVQIDDQKNDQSSLKDMELERRLQKLAAEQQQLFEQHKKNPMLKKFRQTGNLIHQLMMRRSLEIFDPEEDQGLDNSAAAAAADDDDESMNNDEIDWCTTCNEDGVLRCLDCDNDIFCMECFKELHRDREYRKHRTVPYQK